MGRIACKVHGDQGFFEVCEHVGTALREGTILHRKRILEIEVCEACEARYDLRRFEHEPFLDWSDAAAAKYELLNATAECHCIQCIATVELAVARARGEMDPFPPYERTLTFLQRDVVERLEADLSASFHFRQSVVVPQQCALWVCYGAIRCPLEITIYYVTDREHQDAILQWLERFFEDVPQRQRRVLFYRAENWQEVPESPPFLSGHKRGPEELLRCDDTDPPPAGGGGRLPPHARPCDPDPPAAIPERGR